jgi:transcription elongation factor Elf1
MATSEPKGLDADLKCVRCGSEMRFSCTEPDKTGFVHHVYECRKCRSTQSFVTPTNANS